MAAAYDKPILEVTKDPDAEQYDIGCDWSAWLGADTIVNSEWIAVAGITISSDSSDATTTTAYLTGGTAGSVYDLVNRITTAAGRVDDRTIRVHVKHK